MSSTMSGCSLHQLFILWNTPQPLNSLSTEHCTYSDGFTLSEAVTGTPTTNDYLQLTFPKFRTLEKFTYRNVSPFNADMSSTISGCSPISAIHFVEYSSTLILFKRGTVLIVTASLGVKPSLVTRIFLL